MAQKSKTQRAKASAARAARKEARKAAEEAQESQPEVQAAVAETPKKRIFSRKKDEEGSASASQGAVKSEKKDSAPAKKKKKGFLREVRSEMKRVTWPTKQDVLRWSVVVVCALVFFGVTVAVLDNLIITPALVALSGLGA